MLISIGQKYDIHGHRVIEANVDVGLVSIQYCNNFTYIIVEFVKLVGFVLQQI